MSTFTQDQVADLRAIEKARLTRGEPGVRAELQELINRLKSGGVAGKSDDLRTIRAKRMFDLGVGRELGVKTFEQYLATIPQIPESELSEDHSFDRLVLEEPRIGLSRLCQIGNIAYAGNDQTFEPWDARHEGAKLPRWIRLQDGRKNRNRAPSVCRGTFATDELGTTALQGVCAYLQIPEVVTDLNQGEAGHIMDLPGSVNRGNRESCAYLSVGDGQARLDWRWSGDPDPLYGSASSRECKP